jgi:hypothetical protein
MKRVIFLLSLLIALLSACMAPPATTMPALEEPTIPVLPSATEPAPTPAAAASNPKLPAASFEAQPYINETAGFALDYPTGWTVNEAVIGDRGSQVQFLSAPELVDAATLPAGGTRVSATVYQWDPKNDLAAYVANRKAAWEASGFTILEEEQRVLELGLPAVQFTLQTPEAQVIFLFAALGDQYLELSGEGDLELVKEIVGRVRPISR